MSPERQPADRPAEPHARPEQRPAAAHGQDANEQGGRLPGVDEIGGPKGPEPTRFGDWEKRGRCSDF